MIFRKLQTLTLVLLLVCAMCIAPGMAGEPTHPTLQQPSQQQKTIIQKDIEEKGWHVNESGVLTHLYREFTFCDDSIGGGYRLPDGAHILYAKGYTAVWDKTGKLIANISDENAGPRFGPGTAEENTPQIVPSSIEVPSGSYVFHEDNGDTTIARDLDKTDIISTHSETFPPSEKGDAENAER